MAIVYKIDKDLEDIIPSFMKGRERDILQLTDAIASEDFEEIESIGHKLKGNAGSYGFEALGNIGKNMEVAGKEKKLEEIKKLFEEYKDHFAQIEIEFV